MFNVTVLDFVYCHRFYVQKLTFWKWVIFTSLDGFIYIYFICSLNDEERIMLDNELKWMYVEGSIHVIVDGINPEVG
jgi:hypothetical protein